MYKHHPIHPSLPHRADINLDISKCNKHLPKPIEGATIYERFESFFWFDGAIALSVNKKVVPPISKELLNEELELVKEIFKHNKANVIADISNATIQDKKQRDSRKEEHLSLIANIAMISEKPIMRMAASLYLSIVSPPFNARVFKDYPSARKWMDAQLA